MQLLEKSRRDQNKLKQNKKHCFQDIGMKVHCCIEKNSNVKKEGYFSVFSLMYPSFLFIEYYLFKSTSFSYC